VAVRGYRTTATNPQSPALPSIKRLFADAMLAEKGLPIGPTFGFSQNRYNLFGFESFPRHLGLLSDPETNSRIGLNQGRTVTGIRANDRSFLFPGQLRSLLCQKNSVASGPPRKHGCKLKK